MKLRKLLILSALLGCAFGMAGCDNTNLDSEIEIPEDLNTYKVIAPTNQEYVITGLSEEGYKPGTDVTFSVSLADGIVGKAIKEVKADGKVLDEDDGTYTFKMPYKNVTLLVSTDIVDTYELTYTGTPTVGSSLTFTLTYGKDPVLKEYSIVPGNSTYASYFKVVEGTYNKIKILKTGKFTIAAILGEDIVGKMTITGLTSNVSTIHDTFEEVKTKIPCTASATNSAIAISSDTYTIEGKVVAQYAYQSGSYTDYEMIVCDGTATAIMLMSSDPSEAAYTVGDSIRGTVKFTNYYGIYEGVATTSKQGTGKDLLKWSDFEKTDKEFDEIEAVKWSSTDYDNYYSLCQAAGTKKATTYVEPTYVSIDATYKSGLFFSINGSTRDINITKSTIELSKVEGVSCTLTGYLLGANTNASYSYLVITEQKSQTNPTGLNAKTVPTELAYGKQFQTEIEFIPITSFGEIEYSSSNPDVLSVDENGLLTNKLPLGSENVDVTITVKCGSISQSFVVTCKAVAIPATSLEIGDLEKVNFYVGQKTTLPVTVLPATATDSVVVTSSDPTIAKVLSDEITIKGKSAGTVTLTITCGSFTKTCEITVVYEHGTQVNDPLTVDEAYEMASALAKDAYSTIPYYIEATVNSFTSPYDSNYGNFSIDGITTNGNKFVFYRVADGAASGANVQLGSKIVVYSYLYNYYGTKAETDDAVLVSIDNSTPSLAAFDNEVVTCFIGDTIVNKAQVRPAGIVDVDFEYTSSNPVIAEVDSNGTITPKVLGEVTITATSKDANYPYSCTSTVNVVELKDPVMSVDTSSGKVSVSCGTTEISNFNLTQNSSSGLWYYQTASSLSTYSISTSKAYWSNDVNKLAVTVTSSGGKALTLSESSMDRALYACLLDENGEVISGTETLVTSVFSTTIENYTVNIPVDGSKVYGVKVYIARSDSWNLRLTGIAVHPVVDTPAQ